MKAKTHSLKWYLLNCFLRKFIILWLVCLYCSNINIFLLTWVCSSWNNLQFFPNFRTLKVHVLWCETGIYCWNGSEKVLWCMKINFQFHFFAIASISASISSIIAWEAPASSWSPSELSMFWFPVLFCRSVIFNIPKRYQVYVDGPCFQTIFLFLVIMVLFNIEMIVTDRQMIYIADMRNNQKVFTKLVN